MYQLTWKNKELFNKESILNLSDQPFSTRKVERVLPLNWEEHCVECAIPSCYESCSLYSARDDMKCARFVYGIYPNSSTNGLLNFGADISFKKWAKLESFWPKNPRMITLKSLRSEDAIIRSIENLANTTSNFIKKIDSKKNLSRLVSRLIEHWVRIRINKKAIKVAPHAFYLQFYYPGQTVRKLQLELSGDEPFYRSSIDVNPGWNEKIIDYLELKKDFKGLGRISLWPEDDQPIRLIFNWLDLVTFQKIDNQLEETLPAKKIKCVCWDLDNTLWNGVIGDDGTDGVIVNNKIIDLINEFDKKGILQTITSKNEYEIAWSKIKQLGLDKFFLYPAINWGPKSESIKQIAKELNIGIDTFALIDDSEWEREEVSSNCPQVRVYHPDKIINLSSGSEFNTTITKETEKRREMYAIEAGRKKISANWGNDLEGFLKNCEMIMEIRHPDVADLQRCLELLQRTNQFNLSGRNFNKDILDSLLEKPNIDSFCVSLKDRFGDYGIVMFALIENNGNSAKLVDFVMSCRVAQKMADITFLQWCLDYFKALEKNNFYIELKETYKNKPLRDLLDSLPLEKLSSINNGDVIFQTSVENKLIRNNLIKIEQSLPT